MLLVRFLTAALIGSAANAAGVKAADDPILLYGPEIRFDVLRQGRAIGSHVVIFRRTGGAIETSSEVKIDIGVLIFNVFRYRYNSEAVWQDSTLRRLAAQIDDNGKRTRLDAVHEDGRMVVSGTHLSFNAESPLYPTEHWNAAVLRQRRVLNTLTGRLNEVTIEPGPRAYVPTERGPVSATLYRYTGDLDADVWYDDAGRWVKLRFEGRDGSTIEYICRRCQGALL